MKELDFDELDRAVNSLMGDKKNPSDSTASQLQPPSISGVDSPSASSGDSVAASVTPPVSQPTLPSRSTPPAVRRGGRFMDVVSAPRKDTVASLKPVSRQGTTLQPASPAVDSELVKPVDASVVVSDPTPSTPPLASDWPDPLELATKDEPVSIDESAPAEQEPQMQSPTEPLSSPFLADAKVEKRPLGGAQPSAESALMVEDENAQLPALPKDVEPALPEELHGDVVSIEADNSTTDPAKHTTHEVAPKPETEKEPKPLPKEAKPAVMVAEAVVPSGPTSIPQQYKEEPSTGDDKNGAIYDTDSYHQPLSHPAKKKSGWSWVFWILLILIVGAGGGAALYFLGIF